jgi:metal transporter CNNM
MLSVMLSSAEGLIPVTSGSFWLYVGICTALVLVGGVVSGLTIGLFSLSNLELEVLQEDMEADEADRRRAKRLEPLLREERHHLLLVTLLLTNTAAMEALPEMLDKLVPEWAAVLISVSLVLLFSEIIPQSICTRSPLAVGAAFSPVVWLLMLVLFPVAWPIAKALDCLIGKEGGTQFLASRSQVTSLLEIIKRHNILSVEEAKIMQTVVQLRNKQIKDVMIPPEEIYMVSGQHNLRISSTTPALLCTLCL